MVQGNATLVLDLGNSETRGIVLFGKDSNGKFKRKKFTLSNRFAPVAETYLPPADYDEASSTIFALNAVVDGEQVSGVFANGEVQAREFSVAPIRPFASEKKYKSLTSALSYEMACLAATKAIMMMTRTSDIKQVDVNWNVFVLLPPGDMEHGKTEMSEMLSSVKRVECAFPDVDFDIKVNSIVVLPEGYCAFMGVLFEEGNILRSDYKFLTSDITLVCDIGAGTTDVMVMQDGRIIQTTMATFERGGNNVTQFVKKTLRNTYGLKLTEVDIINGIVNGFVKDGAKHLDITQIVNDAKDAVARGLVLDIQNFFEETEYPIRSIAKLFVCGGGSMTSEGESPNSKIKALSEAVVEHLKKGTPNVELVQLPKTVTNVVLDDGTSSKVERELNPRMLNIIGASILAEGMSK